MLDVAIWNPRVGMETAGGTETFLRNLSAELQQREDTRATVYTHEGQDVPYELETVFTGDIRTLPKEHTLNKALARHTPLLDAEIESVVSWCRGMLNRQFSDFDHDVLSTHYYLDAILLSRSVDIPTVFRLPGIKQESPRWDALWCYSDCSEYISNSPTTTERVQEWYNRELAGPVYAGVDTERFSPVGLRPENTILYVGRLGKGKGIKQLVRAAHHLCNDYTVRIVGDGPLSDWAAEHKSANTELVGTVPHSRIHEEYQNATVTVLPTVHEAFPVTVIESLACGTPVIASDIDATRLTIDDGETGFLLQDREPKTIANAVQAACKCYHLQGQARQQGPRVAREYSWQEQANKYRQLLLDQI